MRAPKGKMPYIVTNDGERIADSEMIYTYLCKHHGLDLTSHLTDEQHAQGYLLARAFEEHLYFCIVAHRWAVDENWAATRDSYFSDLPPVVKQILPPVIRRSMVKNLRGQGMGRHTMDETYEFASRALVAFAAVLGNRTYLFGDQISYADTCIGPQVSGCSDGESSPLQAVLDSYPSLSAYGERVCSHVATASITPETP